MKLKDILDKILKFFNKKDDSVPDTEDTGDDLAHSIAARNILDKHKSTDTENTGKVPGCTCPECTEVKEPPVINTVSTKDLNFKCKFKWTKANNSKFKIDILRYASENKDNTVYDLDFSVKIEYQALKWIDYSLNTYNLQQKRTLVNNPKTIIYIYAIYTFRYKSNTTEKTFNQIDVAAGSFYNVVAAMQFAEKVFESFIKSNKPKCKPCIEEQNVIQC